MTFPMANDEYYREAIDGFVREHGLVESTDFTTGVDPSVLEAEDTIDLFFRFPDGRPALGFEGPLPNKLWRNNYLGPDIEDAWMEEVAE